MPGVRAESRAAESARVVSVGTTCDCAAVSATNETANDHKSAFRCTRNDRDGRASGAGSQVHWPPVYFTP